MPEGVQSGDRSTGKSGARLLLALLLSGLLVGGYVAWEDSATKPPPPPPDPKTPVRTEVARTATVTDDLPAYGTLRPRFDVTVTAPQAGQLREILFKDGATVSPGERLAILDNRVAQAELEAARARLLADQQNLRRVRDLARQGLESTHTVEQAQSQVAASLSTVRVNETRLELTTLRAPFAGVLGTHQADPGAMLNAGDKIVSLEDRSRLLVDIRVPSRYLPQLRVGMEVSLEVPSLGENLGWGRLTLVDSSVSVDTRSVLLRAEVDNEAGRLSPGAFVRVVLRLATRPNAVVVPEQAIVRELVGAFVFVIEDGVARRRPVQLGIMRSDTVEIVQGLAANARIVVVGAFRLRDGDPVEERPALTGGG